MDELGRQRELGEIFLAIAFAAMAGLGAWLTSSLLTLFGTIGALSSITLYVWQRNCLARLSYHRTISATRADFGESITIGVELVNDKILPLPWVRVVDRFPRRLFPNQPVRENLSTLDAWASPMRVALSTAFARDQLADQVAIESEDQTPVDPESFEYTQSFAMLPFQRIHRTINVHCNSRGRHRFGDSQVISGDPLGIRPRTLHIEHHDELIVYPKIFPLLLPSIFSRTPLGDDRIRRHLLGDPTRIAGMRQYRPGDPLRHVDWRATARRSELLVRDFEPTTTLRLEVFVNCAITTPDEEVDAASSPGEFALSLAASLVSWAGTQGIPIGLHVNGNADGQPITSPPAAGPHATMHLLEQLALCEIGASSGFGELLLAESPHLHRGSTAVVITSDFGHDLLLGIAECRRRSPVLAVQLLGLEGDPPPRNLVDASYQVAYRTTWQQDDHVIIA